MTSDLINIYLAGPRGFCAGVERAILMVEEAIKKYIEIVKEVAKKDLFFMLKMSFFSFIYSSTP